MDRYTLDLNLLASLNVLIEEANVTRAAARLGVSQPALSAQLARLRGLFGDPLLVPSETGRGMLPTTRALQIKDPLHAALKELERIVRQPSDFDPLHDSRHFAVAASDNAAIVLGLPFIERLRTISGPGVRISFETARADLIGAQFERGEIDLVIGSDRMVPPSIKARKLISERFVMIQRKGHPRGTSPLDLDGYCSLEHVLVSTSGGSLYGFMDEQLDTLGYKRNVVLSVHQFILAPMVVERTDFVSTLPERLARRFADRIDIFELPFEAQGFELFAGWHPRSDADPAHIWLRSHLIETGIQERKAF
jgi:DNA-binding transcriptional LysR family regulator